MLAATNNSLFKHIFQMIAHLHFKRTKPSISWMFECKQNSYIFD